MFFGIVDTSTRSDAASCPGFGFGSIERILRVDQVLPIREGEYGPVTIRVCQRV
jgi:hypothetical protein